MQERVARNVRRIRVRLKLSQERLAIICRMDRGYISRLERGLERPTLTTLERLAKCLGVDVSALVADTRGPLAKKLPTGRRRR